MITLAAMVLLVAGGPRDAHAVLTALPDDQAAAQRLFEAGSYDAVAQSVAAERQKGVETPESTFLAAQAYLRLEQTDRAAAEFARLRAGSQPAWKLIGESGAVLLQGNAAGAAEAARKAAAVAGDLPWAHYQLGLAASRQSDFATATQAFGRATELKPDLAYAHYYGALACQRQRQLSKAAEHFDAFLRLAPEAPERQAVQAIMRTLR